MFWIVYLQSYEAKLSDFGLARLGPTIGYSHVTTQVMGTYGYAAPEYIATGKYGQLAYPSGAWSHYNELVTSAGHLYAKSDVYTFGVLLLEMMTGLRALDISRPSGQHILVDWIKPYLSKWGNLKEIIDVRLEGRYPKNSLLQLATVAFGCLEADPKKRPSMEEIVHTLERIDSAKDTPTQTSKNRFFWWESL